MVWFDVEENNPARNGSPAVEKTGRAGVICS